jgi:hypothetical protein
MANFKIKIDGTLLIVDPKVTGYDCFIASVNRSVYHIVMIGGGDSVKEMYQTIAKMRLNANGSDVVWMDRLLAYLRENFPMERTSALWPVIPPALLQFIQDDMWIYCPQDEMLFIAEKYVVVSAAS